MANKELTVADRLQQLFKLQIIDSELDEIEVLKGELPMEVNDLEDEIVGLNTRASKLDLQIQEIEAEVSRHTANIKESELLIEKYKKQMDNVKNNREFEALTKELDIQSLEIQLSEKKIRELRIGVDAKKETLAGTNESIAVRDKDLQVKKEELDGIIAKTEKEEKELRKK